MSDDFGTVNVRRGDRAREIEVMRQQYRTHRDALLRMGADAPTEHLAGEYHRLAREIEVALSKLDELDGRAPAATMPGSVPLPPPPEAPPPPHPARRGTSAGERPLAAYPASDARPDAGPADDAPLVADPGRPNATSRVALIVIAGALVLAAIVWLIWRGSERRTAGTAGTTVVEQPAAGTAVGSTAPVTPATDTAVAPAGGIRITPAIADYGVIRKGTRAVRQFEVVNTGSTPVTLQVARSACRCLFYDYHDKVAAKGKETITVTVDGAKAKAGSLRETLGVKAKEDPTIAGEMTVQAIIK